MWIDSSNAYEAGHFQLGQTVWHIKDKIHKFRFYTNCNYCDSSGIVLIKGKEFKCPNCRGSVQYKEVVEKVVDTSEKIKSVLSIRNKNEHLETYSTDETGYGLLIQKRDDGSNYFFSSKEEAQKECDHFNVIHGVYRQLEEYANRKDRIFD